MRILIIRHGDPNYERDTLTEKGKREAELLAKRLSKEKIDYIYTSPLGRAKDTCAVTAKALGKENEVEVKEWLSEFEKKLVLPSGRERTIAWDMLPNEWIDEEKMYDRVSWHQQDFYRAAGMENAYNKVCEGLDAVLAERGYIRDKEVYRTRKGNTDTVALFCHFGLEMVLLSHLCGISPIPLWHHFVARTSSLTTLYTEERREGTAVFRCCGFGETGHLFAGDEEPSFSARFCEVYGNGERQD